MTARRGPGLDLRPEPESPAIASPHVLGEVSVPAGPGVDRLGVANAETPGDLGRRNKVVDVDVSAHRPDARSSGTYRLRLD